MNFITSQTYHNPPKALHSVYLDDGTEVTSAEYRRTTIRETIGEDGWLLLTWLKARNNPNITLVEMCKAGPSVLRKAEKLRGLMQKLCQLGLAQLGRPILYSGALRKETWQIVGSLP